MEENKTAAYGEDIIAGRNAITEALRTGRTVDSIYAARGNCTGSIGGITVKAKQLGIPVKDADPKKLGYLCGHANHQGMVMVTAVKEYASLEDLSRVTEEWSEPPFLLTANGPKDPHNLGVILRTTECSGMHGMIIPCRRTTGLTLAVGRASVGVAEYVPVVRMTNLSSTLEELKKRGTRTYAADTGGQDWCGVDYRGPAAVVIGSEGFGVSRLIREKSDFIISLPMLGKTNSLSTSVACGVIRYEVVRQCRGTRAR